MYVCIYVCMQKKHVHVCYWNGPTTAATGSGTQHTYIHTHCTHTQRLKQVLHNILGNAAKFTTVGYINLSVQIDHQEQLVYFRVTDTGPGIAPDKLENVFKPYKTVCIWCMYVCMYVCMHACISCIWCMYVCIKNVLKQDGPCVCLFLCIRRYVCMHACMYVFPDHGHRAGHCTGQARECI
jgi:hypothetical protein